MSNNCILFSEMPQGTSPCGIFLPHLAASLFPAAMTLHAKKMHKKRQFAL
jgi:hypothetical protein